MQLSKEQLDKQLRIGYAEKQKEGEIACVKRILGEKEAQTQKVIDELKKQEENEKLVNDKVVKFLTDRTNDYKQKCEQWDRKNEQDMNKMDSEIREIKAHREEVKKKLDEVKAALKKEEEDEKRRTENNEKKKKDEKDKENQEKAKEQAIIWIQRKLKELYPFKGGSKKKGHKMAMMKMK